MLATIDNKSLLKALAAGTCGALLSLAALTQDAAAETITITMQPSSGITIVVPGSEPDTGISASLPPGNCLYSIQLAGDTELRAAFMARVATLNNSGAAAVDDSDLYTTNIDVNTTLSRTATGTDGLSNDCLSCHDGVMAKSFHVRIKNNPAGRVMSLEDIIGGHPVGMEYDKYVSVNGKEYRRDVSFSRNMIFAEGKVGCLTCHNPLNGKKGHLVMKNERSELCFACHNK